MTKMKKKNENKNEKEKEHNEFGKISTYHTKVYNYSVCYTKSKVHFY